VQKYIYFSYIKEYELTFYSKIGKFFF
jgi:hypothetical protein